MSLLLCMGVGEVEAILLGQMTDIPSGAVALENVLVQSFQSAFFASLAADTTAVAGFNGEGLVQIEGKKWTMIDSTRKP